MRTTANFKSTTSLAFTKDGVLNPEAIDFFKAKNIATLVLFSDGSNEAFEHIKAFDFSSVVSGASQLAAAQLPLWDMRVINPNGELSAPQYVFTDANRIDWFCSNICAPLIDINMSDITSQSNTKVQLDRINVERMVEMSFRFWTILKVAEARLGFPAMAIDALTRWTRVLAPEHLDIPLLRKETGLKTLEYNNLTDTLSLEVVGELFTVKLAVLDAFYKNDILPFFNRYQGRRYNMEVFIRGLSDPSDQHRQMSYGELGSIVDQMQGLIKSRKITPESPMDAEDLLAYSKKVKIDGESCVFGHQGQTIPDFLQEAKELLLRASQLAHNDLSASTPIVTNPHQLQAA